MFSPADHPVRLIEREAARNMEVLWLVNRLKPTYKTIADFRKEHALATLKQQRQALQPQAQAMAEQGLKQEMVTEPEARLMRTAHQGFKVAYNAQTAVDAKHKLIAAFELTNEGNDAAQRVVVRGFYEDAMEAMHQRAMSGPIWMKGYNLKRVINIKGVPSLLDALRPSLG